MILHALKEYYDRKAADSESGIAPPGWEKKEIPFLIVLDRNGKFVQFEDTREMVGKKKRGREFIVPKGVKKTSGVAANLFWDNAAYIFGIDSSGKPERALEQRLCFLGKLKKLASLNAAVLPIVMFLENLETAEFKLDSLWNEIEKENPNLSFRFFDESKLSFENPSIKKVVNEMDSANGKQNTCLITGNKGEISILHSAIKGVYGAKSSGANIVSFNSDAFTSYNKIQGMNSPVSTEAEFAYTTALNTLLSKESKQRLLIRDCSIVFWSQKRSCFENDFSCFFTEPPKDNPDSSTEKIRTLLQSSSNGAYLDDTSSDNFFVLGLAPNAARISVRFWKTGTIANFSNAIRMHFEDLAIVKGIKEPEYYSVWRILTNLATLDKSENIPPNLVGDFVFSILNGTPYPATTLQAALRRIHSDTEYRVKAVRAAIIKAYLNRYHRFYKTPNQKELLMSLDVKQSSKGYQLGRLFAVLEKIQEEANPGLNATIRERYYGSACASPVTVFAILMRLKNHHLAKMENRGRVVNFERILSEIISNLTDFPAHLDLHEQGRFAIGYYHQRQDFFTRKEEN